MLLFLLFIVILILAFKNKKMKKELDAYKLLFKQNQNNIQISNKMVARPIIQNKISAFSEPVTTKPIKEKRNEIEIKNNAILITGSILIIVSAILFLTTTWNTSANSIKTLILFLMFIVFLATSKIARDYLKLEETSKVFYNIAFSYIPIMLFSISLFGLFGSYFAINGPGKYIFFALSSFFIAFAYYISSFYHENKILNVGSYIFQVLFVIFLVVNYTNNYNIIFISLLIYNIFIATVFTKVTNVIYKKIHNFLILDLYYAITSLAIIFNFEKIFLNSYNTDTLILFIIILIASKVIIDYKLQKKDIYRFIYPLAASLISLNFTSLITENININAAILLITLIGINVYEGYFKKNITNYLIAENTIICCLVIFNLLNQHSINEWMVLVSYTGLLFITYKYNSYKSIISYCFPIMAIISVYDIFYRLNISMIYLPFINIIIEVLLLLGKKYKHKLIDSSEMVNTIFLITMSLINLVIDPANNILYLIFIIIIITYLGYGLLNNLNVHKYISYLALNALSLKLFYDIDIDSIYVLAIPFVSLILYMLNYFVKNSYSKNYMVFQYIFSFIYIMLYDTSFEAIFANIIICILIYFQDKNNKFLKCCSIISFIPFIYLNNEFLGKYAILLSPIAIVLLCIKAYQDKGINKYSILAFVYTILHITSLDSSKYINLLLLMLLCTVHILTSNAKTKDIFKFFDYIFGYIILNCLIYDYITFDSSIIQIALVTILSLLISRTILNKYLKRFKILEYIALIVIGFMALELTGDSNSFLLAGVFLFEIIIGYSLLIGPLFSTSSIFLILLVLKLTQAFWLGISWWIYILGLGSILIIFAVNNELKERNGMTNNADLKKIWNKLKDKFKL